MRTPVRLNDDLLTAAEQRAASDHTTLTALIEDSLTRTLASSPTRGSERFRVRAFGNTKTQPGVHLDNSAALRDLVDGLS